LAAQAYRTLFAGQGKKALTEPAVVSIAAQHGKRNRGR
jgi:hypothetical protein